jgi:hypothetical protein
MIEGVWENVKLGPHIHMKGWELVKGTNRVVYVLLKLEG